MWLYIFGIVYLIGYIRHVINYYYLLKYPSLRAAFDNPEDQQFADQISAMKNSDEIILLIVFATGLIWPRFIWANFKSGLRGWTLVRIHRSLI